MVSCNILLSAKPSIGALRSPSIITYWYSGLTDNPCVAVRVAVLTAGIAGISMILTPTGALEGLGLEAASEREEARPNLVFKLTRDPDAQVHARVLGISRPHQI